MNQILQAKWDEAQSNPGKTVDIGSLVVCDICDTDYTERDDPGGFIFGSKAYCPSCGKKSLPDIKHYHEEGYIKAVCPDGTPFADFVRNYRGDNNTICFKHIGG